MKPANESLNPTDADNSSGGRLSRKKVVVLLCVTLAAGVGYWFLRDYLTLPQLAQQEAQLRQFQRQNPIFVYGAAFSVYVVVTGLSLPGATHVRAIDADSGRVRTLRSLPHCRPRRDETNFSQKLGHVRSRRGRRDFEIS